MGYFILVGISLSIGIITGLVSFILFRRYHIGVWAFFAGLAPDWPHIFLTPLGLTNLDKLLWITHTIGIFIFPILLVIADILLIEIGLVRYLKPLHNILPKSVKSVIKIQSAVSRLQKYRILPSPTKIQLVYLAGVLSGLIHLLINFLIGQL